MRLDEVCAGDEGLRREVESLISAYDQSSKCIDTPALEVDAAIIAGSESDSAGRLVGHYQTSQRLGVGGMGEVYLASDTRTDRKVSRDSSAYVFDPKVLILTYQAADMISRTDFDHSPGIFEIRFQDDPSLQGDYTLFLQLKRLP